MKNRILILGYFLFFINMAWSQINPLEKRITLKANHISVEKALNSISSNAKIFFSYNSDILPLDSVVNLNFDNTSVAKALNQMLGQQFVYKSTGQHIIIQKKKQKTQKQEEKIFLKGSVIEFGTGLKIANASIYHINGKEGILSDANGDFLMPLMPKGDFVSLAINKSNYRDTIIFVKTTDIHPVEISLKPELYAVASIKPSIGVPLPDLNVEQSNIVPRLVGKEMIMHALNIKFLREMPVQFSVLPFIGTNHKLSGSIVNKFSFNLIGGYSYGLDGVEVGGFLNINRKQVNGLQISGFGNITGDNTNGVQIAGFFNHNFGKMDGVQISGFYNALKDSLDGAQISGFANLAQGKMDGVQIAGFANVTTNEVDAVQVSGFTNVAFKSSKGTQVSGFANVAAADYGGAQVSGFANFTRGNIDGAQIAGFANVAAKEITGTQVSGFVNCAQKVKGFQIGVVNIADTVSGASFGIFNFIRKGLHQIAVGTTESLNFDASLSLGTYRFYTIFGATAHYFENPKFWGAYIGFGTRFWGTRMFNVDLQGTVGSQNIGNVTNWFQSQQSKLSMDLNLRLSKHIAIYAGPSFNVFRYNTSRTDLAEYPTRHLSSILFENTSNGSTKKAWIGAQAGLKFRF